VPRDAETVVLHALEKDPERRYATAAAFADDLDAVLTSRPVAARPPGALGRARKWCRRRPVPAAVAATLAVAVVVGAAILVSRDRAAAQERRDRAASIVADARERLAAYRRSRESAATLDAAVAERRIAVSTRYQTAEEDAAADGTEDAAAAARRARDTGFFEVLDLLRAAELLDPGTPGTEPIRAELFREKWLEARVARDREGAAFYRDLVGRHDAEGRFARELDGVVRLSFRTDPPGAKVWLFDVHEQAEVVAGGEHRLVPVPPPGAPFPVAPGTPCLRVVRGADDGVKRVEPDDLIVSLRGRPAAEAFLVMRATAGPGAPTGVGRVHGGDRLVSVDGVPVRSRTDLAEAAASTGEPRLFTFERDGRTFDVGARSLGALDVEVWDPERCAEWGGPAQVVRDGRAEDVVLPRGLVVRTTVAPVLLSEASALGRTPVDGVEVAEGLHVAVVEAPGRPRVRLAFRAAPGDQVVRSIRLPPAGPAPDGFVFIPGAEDLPAFWMMEREVTAAEYLEFLNDPAVRARIAASPDPVLFPRTPENRREGGSWRRDAEGRFVLPPGAAPDLPVLGVSWHDAREYAAWRSARDAGQDVARDPEHPARAPYRLPTFREWVFAADGNSGRSYPFGDRFHARWVKSCFARPHAGPEPVRSYPVDESAYGVFDLCGSAYEWADGWWDESRGLRRLAGGSWAQGEVARFNAYGGSGAEASFAGEETGFRLVFPAEAAGR
jgi:hypothetical protein